MDINVLEVKMNKGLNDNAKGRSYMMVALATVLNKFGLLELEEKNPRCFKGQISQYLKVILMYQ